MLYELEQGRDEDALVNLALKNGMPIPEYINNAPQLWPGLGIYYKAFWDLMSSRMVAFGPGPIPWDAVDRYAERRQFDDDQRVALEHHIQLMDVVYLKYWNDKHNNGG